MNIFTSIFTFIVKWFTKMIFNISAKYGIATVQTVFATAIMGVQTIAFLAIVNIVFMIFNTIQTFIDYVYSLQDSASVIISTAVSVTKAVGVWDGSIDALTLVMPLFTSILLIRISVATIKLLTRMSTEADRIFKTVTSHGVM